MTPDFALKSLVLFTVHFPAGLAKTGANIQKVSKDALENLGITWEDIKDVVHVPDEGSNILLALANMKHISCSAHNLATVLRHLLHIS